VSLLDLHIADTGTSRPRGSAWLRFVVLVRRGRLDRLLVQGTSPASDRRLALRAAQLAQPALRASLAAGLRDAMRSVDDGPLARRQRPHAPVEAASVGSCLDELEDLARALTDVSPRVRGVAIVCRLFHDGLGPLYTAGQADRLRNTVLAARAAL
jgi:hypothetical protein